MKRILKIHEDAITVPEMMKDLRNEYEKIGYTVEELTLVEFKLVLDDGEVFIYWDHGKVYEEIKEDEEKGDIS